MVKIVWYMLPFHHPHTFLEIMFRYPSQFSNLPITLIKEGEKNLLQLTWPKLGMDPAQIVQWTSNLSTLLSWKFKLWIFQIWKIFFNNFLQKQFQWWQFIGIGLGTIILIFISHPFELLKYAYLIFK
jgi:hypothetical protein